MVGMIGILLQIFLIKNLSEHLMPGLSTKGVPKELKNLVFPFTYNNLEQLENIIKKNDVGIIKMEVARSERPKDNFLSEVARSQIKKYSSYF